jgi:hypothetical protein
MTLWDGAAELSRRLTPIFLCDEKRRQPVHGGTEKFQTDPWRDLVLFLREKGVRSQGLYHPAIPALIAV